MIPARCQNCNTRMNRVGVEQATEHGVVATFECPQCHSRTQRTASAPTLVKR